MNKQNKYRAWDSLNKEMRYSDRHDGEFYVNTKGVLYMYKIPNTEEYFKTYDVMEFIGKQDSKGRDVYEGDYDKDFQVVHWCEKRNGWAMSIYDFPTKDHICCHCYSCEGNYEISEVIDEIEIAGNIYENAKI